MTRVIHAALQWFFTANRALSERLARALSLPSDKPMWAAFERRVGALLGTVGPQATVLDLGGGRRCVYAGHLRELQAPPRMIAVDISAQELACNDDVAEVVVADVARALPFADASVDLIVSRMLLEHVDGVPAAVAEMARVLRPGGRMIHMMPCRHSLFALSTRLAGFERLRALLHLADPATRGQVEFPVHYDHCLPSEFQRLAQACGMRSIQVHVCWAAPGYFAPLVPMFLLASAWERVLRGLKLRDMASYMIVEAVR